MIKSVVWGVLMILVVGVLLVINMFFYSSLSEKDGVYPFECGIEPLSEVKSPFFMHFFFISILFLVFDIELAISIPLIFSSVDLVSWGWFWMSFMLILFLGLVFEIFLGTLDWKE